MSAPSILVVDDDVPAQRALIQVLKKEGYVVDGVSSGALALKKLQERLRISWLASGMIHKYRYIQMVFVQR